MNNSTLHSKSDTRPSRALKAIAWFSLAAVVLALGYLGIGAYVASEVTKIGDHPQFDHTPKTYGVAYEDVRLMARGDGTEIAAWYLPHEGSSSAIILVHGRDASKQNAITGHFPQLGAALHKAGHAVLMIDMRGHGGSEGVRYSFGVYERRDVLGAVDWLLAEGFEPGKIGVLGLSMGGGATISAAAEEPAIGVLVLESTFADLWTLVGAKFSEESGLPNPFLPGVRLMNRLMYGYDLKRVRPIEEIVEVAPRPIMIIHCSIDEDVPLWHAEQLMQVVPDAETWVMDACEHADIYRDYPQAYEQLVTGFFGKHLGD